MVDTPANNNTTISGILKKFYRDGGLVLETYRKRPYWTMLTKKADSSSVEGSTFQFATQINDNQARNVTFQSAQAQARGLSAYNTSALTGTVAGAPGTGSIGVTQWTCNRAYNYAYATISTELELSARTKRGAFQDAVVTLTQSTLNVLGNDQEISFLGGNFTSTGITTSASGFISQVGSTTDVTSSTGVLTLAYVVDSTKFSYGQELDLYYNNSGVITKRTNIAGYGLFVGSVDRTKGTLVIVNSAGTPIAINSVFSNAAVGDFICVSNDFNYGAATGNSGYAKVLSVESYIPFGGPLNDSPSNLFNGVNRSVGDVTRLSGNWLDATGGLGPNGTLNIEDAIMGAMEQVALQSDKAPDTIALNHNQKLKLLKSNMSRTFYPGGSIQTPVPELSFQGFSVETGSGAADVIPSRFMGANRIYCLHMPSWFYVHLGDPVEQYMMDGNDSLREPDMDAKGFRYFSFGQVVCDEPAAQCVIQIAP